MGLGRRQTHFITPEWEVKRTPEDSISQTLLQDGQPQQKVCLPGLFTLFRIFVNRIPHLVVQIREDNAEPVDCSDY